MEDKNQDIGKATPINNWYVAINPETLDIVKAMEERKSIFLPHPRLVNYALRKVEVGDRFYVYVSKGYAQIMYCLEITELGVERMRYGIMTKYAPKELPNLNAWVKCKKISRVRPAYKPLQCTALMRECFENLQIAKLIRDENLDYIESHFAAVAQPYNE